MAAEEGQVIVIKSPGEWKEQIDKAKGTNKLIVVDFTATWCGPCRFIAPIFADLAKKTPEVIFLKVDVDDVKAVAEQWSVEAMPTFLFLKDGQEVDRIVGANKDGLQMTIAKHATAVV